jgi:hypothetical protein
MATKDYTGVRRRALLSLPRQEKRARRSCHRRAALARLDRCFALVRARTLALFKDVQELQGGAQ